VVNVGNKKLFEKGHAMQKINKQELKALAHLSRLQLTDDEITSLIPQINDVLIYASRVKDIAQMFESREGDVQKNCNVVREDEVVWTDPEPLLKQAPEREQNYFVVPMILETT
jgi:aspartyl-tRNA(Asn)/glutamyl-tRNA(Gln) amidotransferase subunit C